VEIYRGPHAEAEVIAGMLRSAGLDVLVSHDDAGGARPDVGFITGSRLKVRASDESSARDLIAGAEPLAEG
jgi:hypothetical protein